MTLRFLLPLLLCASLAGQQQTVFRRNVFSGITTAQTSDPLTNIGQAVHIVTLVYPSAVADVTSFVFRVEASFDNTTYFAISEDVTTAKYNGSYSYAIARCNGVYPYVRLRLVTANASNALTAHYTGSVQPIGIVRFSTDRYIIDSPLAGATVEWPGVTIGGIYYVENKRMTPVVPADWPTNVNHVAQTTRTDDPYSINLTDAHNAATSQWRLVCRSLPATPYTIRLHVLPDVNYSSGDGTNRVGVVLRNSSSGQLISWSWGGAGGRVFYHDKWNSPSSSNSTYNSSERNRVFVSISIQISDDGTTRSYLMWNGKRTSSPLQPNNAFWGTGVARTDFTTPDQICFGIYHDNGNYPTQGNFIGYDLNPTW